MKTLARSGWDRKCEAMLGAFLVVDIVQGRARRTSRRTYSDRQASFLCSSTRFSWGLRTIVCSLDISTDGIPRSDGNCVASFPSPKEASQWLLMDGSHFPRFRAMASPLEFTTTNYT